MIVAFMDHSSLSGILASAASAAQQQINKAPKAIAIERILMVSPLWIEVAGSSTGRRGRTRNVPSKSDAGVTPGHPEFVLLFR